MPPNNNLPPYEFIAYFDEAGDPGVKAVAPIDKNGASEWFTLGCALVRASNEHLLIDLIRRLKSEINSKQRPDLHFRHLGENKKQHICDALAKEPVRFSVLASNKKNMRNYRNTAAEAVSLHPNNWFYNYCVRILLERVTDWCERRSIAELGESKHVKLVFSKRGGHSYRHVETYTELLSIQSSTDRLYQTVRAPKFSVLDHRLIEVAQHEQNAGCQIADIVASAFYQAVHTGGRKWTTNHAKALGPRIASIDGHIANEGVTLLPWNPRIAALSPKQAEIFRYYGYAL